MKKSKVEPMAVLPDRVREQLVAMDGKCSATAARRAARYLTATADRALAPTGLRVGQFSLLWAAALQGPIPLSELAEAVATDRTTLATNIKPLVRDGLLVVHPSARDGRVREIGATAEGVRRLQDAIRYWQVAQDEFEGSFGKRRADRLRAELRAVLGSGLDPW